MRILHKAPVWLSAAACALLLSTCCSHAGAANVILNGSFEAETHGIMPNGATTSGHVTWGMPDDWQWRNQGPMNAHGTRYDDQVGWSSDGDWALYMFATTATNSVGDYLEFYQTVDLTDVDTITFDAYLRGGTYTESYFSVAGQKLWTRNATDTYLAQLVDVSGLTGPQEIAVGVEAFAAGTGADGWTYFDNLQAVPEPGTLLLLATATLAILGWCCRRRVR